MNCGQYEELIADALWGELKDEARARLDQHMASCPQCARTFAEMQATLATVARRERTDPGQAFWDGYWNRLAARMEREEAERRSRGWLGRLLPGLSTGGLRWAYGGALAVVLVVFGALVGRMMLPGPDTQTPTVAETRDEGAQTSPAAVIQPASAEACARQYIEDSQVVLLALVNFDPETEGEYLADWAGPKQRSRELVAQAASLKGDLKGAKQRRLRELVTELELILLQIANLEGTGDLEAVDLIRSSVSGGDVMLKINLERMRGDDEVPPQPGACDA